jgi:hypothetical protein
VPRLPGPPLYRILNVLIALFGLGHLYAAFYPSVANWGIHSLAFAPAPLRWLIPAAIILLAIPSVQARGLRSLRCAGGLFLGLPRVGRWLTIIIALSFAGLVFTLFHSIGIPGDGQFLIHNLFQIKKPADVAHVYLHEPLTCLIHWSIAHFVLGDTTVAGAEMAFRIASILCGVAFIPLLAVVVRRIVQRRVWQMLAFFFVIASGSSMLFFGHIENYTIALLGMIVFILFSLRHCTGESSLAAPSAAAGVLVPLYFGTMFILPALGYLFLVDYRRHRSAGPIVLGAGTFLVVSLGLLALTGFTPERFGAMLFGGGKHMIGILESTGAMEGYTLFSGRHLADLGNLLLLISPFGLFVGAALLASRAPRGNRDLPGGAFIPILSVSCAMILVSFRCDLGMPRDWDLLSPFMFGAVVLPVVFLLGRAPRGRDLQSMLFASAAATLFHLVPWIMMNHDPHQAIAQNRMVLEQTTWIEGIHTGYEGLAMSSKRRGEYDSAVVYYKEFLRGAPSHARILGNLADVYRILGVEDSERVYTEKAILNGTTVPALYFNLGVIYAGKDRYEDAIRTMREGLHFQPERPDILNSIGAFILRSRMDCDAAMVYFREAIRIDPSYPMAYLNAGECCARAGDAAAMLRYFAAYARLDPVGAQRSGILRRLRSGAPP